jgi:hypothetical protein
MHTDWPGKNKAIFVQLTHDLLCRKSNRIDKKYSELSHYSKVAGLRLVCKSNSLSNVQ